MSGTPGRRFSLFRRQENWKPRHNQKGLAFQTKPSIGVSIRAVELNLRIHPSPRRSLDPGSRS
jgi:hypothetical protein